MHADLFDDQAEQSLALLEVEPVDSVGGLRGEVGDAAPQAVIDGELVMLGFELVAFDLEPAVTRVDFGCSSVEFFHVDVTGLVEVGDAASFSGGLVDAAGEAVELGGEELVVGGGFAAEDGFLAGE